MHFNSSTLLVFSLAEYSKRNLNRFGKSKAKEIKAVRSTLKHS
jgi:hypothetical protein